MLAMLVPKTISRVESAMASQRPSPSPRLGQKIPLNPSCSRRWATSTVALRRPGIAARLIAGLPVMPTAPELVQPFQCVVSATGFRRLGPYFTAG